MSFYCLFIDIRIDKVTVYIYYIYVIYPQILKSVKFDQFKVQSRQL